MIMLSIIIIIIIKEAEEVNKEAGNWKETGNRRSQQSNVQYYLK